MFMTSYFYYCKILLLLLSFTLPEGLIVIEHLEKDGVLVWEADAKMALNKTGSE